jgi:hypothetical protein
MFIQNGYISLKTFFSEIIILSPFIGSWNIFHWTRYKQLKHNIKVAFYKGIFMLVCKYPLHLFGTVQLMYLSELHFCRILYRMLPLSTSVFTEILICYQRGLGIYLILFLKYSFHLDFIKKRRMNESFI